MKRKLKLMTIFYLLSVSLVLKKIFGSGSVRQQEVNLKSGPAGH